MAKVSGKCPYCGQVIYVNDEREQGHCGKCGAEIRTQEAIRLFESEPSSAVSNNVHAAQPDPLRQQRRAERAKERAEREQDGVASQMIQDMFQLCTNEQDYLMLRTKIIQMDRSDGEKARLLSYLDSATSERLKDTLKKAKDYEESQESPMNLVIGLIIIVGIGLGINYFFNMTIPGVIAIVLAVFGVFGDIQKRHDKKTIAENKAAAELIKQYRTLGYKI